MKLTGYLIFEVCRDCNLGDVHPRCPNRHPQRYGTLPVDEPLSDDKIVSIARAMYMEHGFRGRVGWHYYNEPLMDAERMFLLMERITVQVPQASFVLWTNGTLLPEDENMELFRRFDEIRVTDYRLSATPVWHVAALVAVQPKTRVHAWGLDDRLHAIGDQVSYKPCHRMFTEFIIDYFGNVHLCCFDWQGFGSIGNVRADSLPGLIQKWREVRRQIGVPEMNADSPDVCLHCKMRSVGITNFVPVAALAARQYVRELQC